MGFSQSYGPAKDDESKRTLAKALELGCTFWDSAAVYGGGHNERLIGEFVKETDSRDKVFIASKCGILVSSSIIFLLLTECGPSHPPPSFATVRLTSPTARLSPPSLSTTLQNISTNILRAVSSDLALRQICIISIESSPVVRLKSQSPLSMSCEKLERPSTSV